MSVYVDEAVWPYGRMMMCHMLADTDEELHQMAARLGVAKKWHQNDRYSHYDICKSKRSQAILFGAKQIGRREFVRLALSKMKRAHETKIPV